MKHNDNGDIYSLLKNEMLAEVIAIKKDCSLSNEEIKREAFKILQAARLSVMEHLIKDSSYLPEFVLATKRYEYEQLLRELLLSQASNRILPDHAKEKRLDLSGPSPKAPIN